PSTLSCQLSRAVRIRIGKVLFAARSRRMSSSPGTPGSPRSTIATSSGYSSPANTPSSPSRATSTVKPAVSRRAFSPSRKAASSSTTRMRMLAPHVTKRVPPAVLPHGAARGVDVHDPDLAGIIQKPQDIYRAAVVTLRLGLDYAGAVLLLDQPDRLVHGHPAVG